jgi:sugar lactone lactonase YvrE
MADPVSVSVFSDTVCELGEGPSYDRRDGKLYWFDIVGRRLLEKHHAGTETVVHDLPFMGSAIAGVDDQRQLLVGDDGLYLRDRESGALSLHLALEADLPGNRSNDSRVHPSGAFWIGTMPRKEDGPTGSIYWYRKGELRRLYPGIKVSNSICFSPDGATAYFTDTPSGLLMRVACDPATGLPRGEPSVFVDHRGKPGYIDGSVVDAEGVLWNAKWEGSRVDAYAPDGSLIRSIATPALQTSCPAFLGPDADRIAATSAWKGMDGAARAADPQGGRTFVIDLPVRGRIEPDVAL